MREKKSSSGIVGAGGGTKAAADAALDIAAKKLDGAVPLRDANIPGFEGFGGVEGISSAIKSATDVASTAPQEEFDFNTWWNNWLMTPESDYITIPLLVIVSTFFLTNFLPPSSVSITLFSLSLVASSVVSCSLAGLANTTTIHSRPRHRIELYNIFIVTTQSLIYFIM